MDRLLWTQISDMGPPVRRFPAMAYDSDRDRVVLFGGGVFVPRGPDGYPTEMDGQDTWEFDGTIWPSSSGTSARCSRRSASA
jgi:hypothetical protein